MAESRSLPQARARTAPDGPPQRRRARVAARPAPPAIGAPRRRCQYIKDRALAVESELSGDMAVVDKELDAIARLLGDALHDLLVGS